MKQIKLTKGKYAIVDDEDFEWLNQFKWFYDNGYAERWSSFVNGKRHRIMMHRFILGTPFNLEGDHINGDTLDNRKSNLRSCTRYQNGKNRRKQNGTYSSRFKGVSWHKYHKKWQAYFIRNDEMVYIGLFKDEKEAAKAHNSYILKEYGEFAKLNVLR